MALATFTGCASMQKNPGVGSGYTNNANDEIILDETNDEKNISSMNLSEKMHVSCEIVQKEGTVHNWENQTTYDINKPTENIERVGCVYLEGETNPKVFLIKDSSQKDVHYRMYDFHLDGSIDALIITKDNFDGTFTQRSYAVGRIIDDDRFSEIVDHVYYRFPNAIDEFLLDNGFDE